SRCSFGSTARMREHRTTRRGRNADLAANRTHEPTDGADTPEEIPMNVADKTILITGASRGIGRALVDEALRRGAKRVYAGTRGPLPHADARVTAVKLDVTSAEDIRRAVASIDSLDLLVNNAGIAPYDDLSNPKVLERTFAVNLFGVLNVTRAF